METPGRRRIEGEGKLRVNNIQPLHYGSKQPDSETSKFPFSQEFGSEGSELAVEAKDRMEKRVAQYLRLKFWLI